MTNCPKICKILRYVIIGVREGFRGLTPEDPMSKVFLIASGKGGTGKTMFAVNFGALLSAEGKRVALIDMDLGMRNMDLYLGMENRVVFNIMDVLTGICKLNKALLKVRGFDNLYFIAASPRKDERRITARHMQALCDILERYFDYIIIVVFVVHITHGVVIYEEGCKEGLGLMRSFGKEVCLVLFHLCICTGYH